MVVAVHLVFIVFVVAGGLLVVRWSRIALVHLPAVAYGVIIQLVGFTCPLTPLEKWLRGHAGSAGYDGGFVERYLIPVIYPGEFTTGVQLVLATGVLLVNLLAYGVVGRRRTRRRAALAERSGPCGCAAQGAPSSRSNQPMTCHPVSGKPVARATRAEASLSCACR